MKILRLKNDDFGVTRWIDGLFQRYDADVKIGTEAEAVGGGAGEEEELLAAVVLLEAEEEQAAVIALLDSHFAEHAAKLMPQEEEEEPTVTVRLDQVSSNLIYQSLACISLIEIYSISWVN